MKLRDIGNWCRAAGGQCCIGGLCYIVINALFIVKYSARAGVSPVVVTGCSIVVTGVSLLLLRYLLTKTMAVKRVWYVLSVVTVTGILIGLVVGIDPHRLSVDRWSALHNVVAGLLDGQHPFTARSHMDQQASPFPVMWLIAAPFFLMGDVGYLQCGCFLLATIIVAKSAGIDNALWLNTLLILSPAFWYEGAVRSDLFSNFLVIALFMFAATNKKERSFRTNCLIALIAGLLLCTRGVAAIPLICFYGYYLKSIPVKHRAVMMAISGLAAIIPFLPLAVWDWHVFITMNTVFLQSEKTPRIVQVVTMAVTLYVAWRVTSRRHMFLHTFFILFSLMTVSFIVMIVAVGYDMALHQSLFDITYFSLSLPFFVFYVVTGRPAPEMLTDNIRAPAPG